MDPASSSSDEESVESSSSSSSIEEAKNNPPALTSFDDLPTDDSGSEMSSSDEDDYSEDDDDDESDEDNEHESDENSENETLEDRLRARQQNGISRKSSREENDAPGMKRTKKNSDTKSNSKQHAPKEVSSKRSDYFRRGAPLLANNGIASEATGGANRYKPRDPRMESFNGHFDQGAFDHNYAFLEEMQQNEIKQLRARITARKLRGRKGQQQRKKLGISNADYSAPTLEDDENELKRLLQLKANKQKEKLKKEAKSAVKRKMKEEIKSGKRTKEFYYKKKDLKRIELEAQYDALKRKGGVGAIDKLLAKKRKKNLGRDGKYMPGKEN